MRVRNTLKTVKIPENVDVIVDKCTVSITGPLGTLKRNFSHAPIDIQYRGNEILIEASWPNKHRLAMVGTIRSHIQNMITGVLKGFTYRLKIVYAHFPMSVTVDDMEVIIDNFSGERKPRKVKISDTINITVEEDDVVVKGIDLEEVSQTAASIQQATRIKKKDPRIFLDGIYVYEKVEGI